MEYEIVCRENSLLGEGPVWDERNQRLFWIDGLGQKIHIFNPSTGKNISFSTPQPVGSITLTNDDNIIIAALQDGIYSLNLANGNICPYLMLENDKPGNRFNDGKSDCMGRFWFGSMNTAANSGDAGCAATGSVYCLTKKQPVKVFSNVTISNGMGWDPTNRQFYYIDSPQKSIFAFDFELGSGSIRNKRRVIDLRSGKAGELPDGMAVDRDGMLWVAIWGGYRVSCFDPRDGSCLENIILPVKNVTSCAFGGALLNELYITTSNIEANGIEQKTAGALFRIQTTPRGLPASRFLLA